MPASATATAERDPRRARSLSPGDTPPRGELSAALAAAGLLAHLLLAQLTLLLTVALDLTGRVARWRPLWLAGPAAAGFLWVLAIGPGRALAGFTAGPHQVLGYLAGAAGQPARVLHPARAFAGIGRWLPRQAPFALILAPAEAAVTGWLRARHAGERGLPPPRPGLIVAVRRLGTVAWVRSGGVVTRAGACLGADWRTGRPAGISWRAAEGGVLVTGAAVAEVSAASFQLVHAAIRRRKPVLVVDLGDPDGPGGLDGLGGSAGLAGALASICADTGAPLHVFGPAGQGCYEPLRGGDPARKAALVMGMIDWGPVAEHARRTCGAYLNDLFAVAAAAPGDPRVPVLDDVAALLSPAALRARMRQVPPYHPRRVPLGERARVSASLLEADPATASFLAGELTGLRASALGRWLRPAGARCRRCPWCQCPWCQCPWCQYWFRSRADQPERRDPRARGGVLPAGPVAARPVRADDRESGRPRYRGGLRRITAPGRGRRRAGLVRRRGRDRRAGPGPADQHRRPGRAGHRAQHRVGPGGGTARGAGERPGDPGSGRHLAGGRRPGGHRPAPPPGWHLLAGTTLAGATLDRTVLARDQFTLVIRSPQQQVPLGRFVPGRMR